MFSSVQEDPERKKIPRWVCIATYIMLIAVYVFQSKKKFAELDLSLLHLQQNVEIPETHLIIHPIIQGSVAQVKLLDFDSLCYADNASFQVNASGARPNISHIPARLLLRYSTVTWSCQPMDQVHPVCYKTNERRVYFYSSLGRGPNSATHRNRRWLKVYFFSRGTSPQRSILINSEIISAVSVSRTSKSRSYTMRN